MSKSLEEVRGERISSRNIKYKGWKVEGSLVCSSTSVGAREWVREEDEERGLEMEDIYHVRPWRPL